MKKLPQSPPCGGDSKFIVIAYAIIDLESLRYPQNEGAKALPPNHINNSLLPKSGLKWALNRSLSVIQPAVAAKISKINE